MVQYVNATADTAFDLSETWKLAEEMGAGGLRLVGFGGTVG